MENMNSQTFLKRFTSITILVVLSFVAFNLYIDIYGLFLGRKNRIVYINESRYLDVLSFRYVPENFDSFIIGPSLSANLNPKEIMSYKVYNSSIMGANISDLHYLINNIIEKGNIKVAIVCLDPYLTKEFGKKSATIDPKEYYGALGSTNLLKTYLMFFVRKYNLLPDTYAQKIIDENGWNNFELEMNNLNSKKSIEEKVRRKQFEETAIDPNSFAEFSLVLDELRIKNIMILAYYSPIPYPIYSLGKGKYSQFETKMQTLFTTKDIVINLNDKKYKSVTSDYNTFIDHGHLSASGQAFVLKEIESKLIPLTKNEK